MVNLPYAGKFKITKLYGTPPPAGVHYALGYHSGVDLVGLDDKTVRAIAPGSVYRIGYDPDGWGNYVVIRQADGRYAIYCHLAVVKIAAAAKVTPGQAIGIEGATGQVTGRHLHLEIRREYNDRRSVINPVDYLGIKNKLGVAELEVTQQTVKLPDGSQKHYDSVIINGTTYTGLRRILQDLGYKVDYSAGVIVITK